MAEENTVTMTVENIDRLFPEIVVNGESHVSENYVPPVQLEQSVPQTVEEEEEPSTPAQVVQGQDVHAVELNDVLHDFVDPEVAQGLADEIQTRRNADTALQNSINTINSKIPNQASSENKLADKNFVNSSIATNTANFLGTYSTLAEIEAIPNPTNNDYAFLETTDSAGNTVYKRYKYNGESNEWLYEYDLNNSSFTAEQWATINSGLTQQSVDEDIQEAISQVGSGIEVYDTEAEMEEDLPNKQDGDLVGTLSADEGELQDAPLGSVMSYLGNTDPSDGKWLICDGRDTTGTAIELETHYPSLYMFLGGTNVLPEIFDHSRLGAFEDIITALKNGTSSSPYVCDYDGVIVIEAYDRRRGTPKIVWNGQTWNIEQDASDNGASVTTLNVKKGDTIYISSAPVDVTQVYARWYKYHNVIKAVSSVDMYHAPSSEIAQIEQYVDEGINTIKNNGLSYSTTETLTGGKWIDNKPIYRKVVEGTTPSSTGWQAIISSGFENVDTMIKIYGILYTSDGYIHTLPYGEGSYYVVARYKISDKKIYMNLGNSVFGNCAYKLIFEYTKS